MEKTPEEVEVELGLESEPKILTLNEETEEIQDELDYIAGLKEAAQAKQTELINASSTESKQELEIEIYEINQIIIEMQEIVEANMEEGGQMMVESTKSQIIA